MRSAGRDTVVVGVALGPDDAAPLELGRELARLTAARLLLVHAYPYDELIAISPPHWADAMRERATAGLEKLAEPLRAETEVAVQARASPSPVRALHEAAEEVGAVLLVAGASHRRGVARAVPGGIAERLLHAAPCAVAIAPPDRPVPAAGLRRIGVAFVDGPEGAEALALAARLARAGGGRVQTFTVSERRTAVGGDAGDTPQDAGAAHAARARAIVDKVRATVPAELLETAEVLEGRAADELARASAGVDLLICGSRGYGPVRSLLLGGVTWTLAHTAACPLLVVPRAALGERGR
jgi:nucleotide-binding universal stress UspA family protein